MQFQKKEHIYSLNAPIILLFMVRDYTNIELSSIYTCSIYDFHIVSSTNYHTRYVVVVLSIVAMLVHTARPMFLW